MKVFAIDDDALSLAILGNMLDGCGIGADYVRYPDPQWQQKLIKFNPDVILLDLYLKDTTGHQLKKQIRSIEQFKHTPIIAVSGTEDINDKVTVLMDDFSYFINKPIDKSVLIPVVKGYAHMNAIIKMCTQTLKGEHTCS